MARTVTSETGFRTFLIVWTGQLLSIIGTSLTWFGLSLWVYLETGSVTRLSMMLLAATLPRILLSPVAGALVDRWDRRWAMILADGAAGVGTVVIGIAFVTDQVSFGLLLAVGAIASAFEAIHWPAYQAATSLLVPKERYSQASGMVQLAEAAGQLLAPVLGAAAVAVGGVALIIAIDAITFVIAIVTLMIVRFPAPKTTDEGAAARGSLWEESVFGFRYLIRKRPLLVLLMVFAGINLILGFLSPVFIAYLLSFTSETTMGTLLSLSATGMIAGSILASARKVTHGRVMRIVLATVILGAMLIVLGSTTMLVVVLASVWAGMFVVPYASAMSQSIWMSKVEPDVQGRVFSVRSMLGQITQPLALILAGPIADGLFVPMMGGTSRVSEMFAVLVGRGDGAGYGALMVAMGGATILLALVAWSYSPLRNLETVVPDAEGLPSEVEASEVVVSEGESVEAEDAEAGDVVVDSAP